MFDHVSNPVHHTHILNFLKLIHIILPHTHFTNYKLPFNRASVQIDVCTRTAPLLGTNFSYKVGDPAYSCSSGFLLAFRFYLFASCPLVVSLFLHLATLKSLPWEVPCLPLVACLALFSVLTVLCLCHIPLSLINNNNFLTTTL